MANTSDQSPNPLQQPEWLLTGEQAQQLGEAMVGLEGAALLHRQVRNPISRSANGVLTVGYDEGDGHPVFTLRGYPVPLTRQQQGERSLALSGGNADPYPITTTTIHLAGPELLLDKELPASGGDPTIYGTRMMMEGDAEHPTVRVLGTADQAQQLGRRLR